MTNATTPGPLTAAVEALARAATRESVTRITTPPRGAPTNAQAPAAPAAPAAPVSDAYWSAWQACRATHGSDPIVFHAFSAGWAAGRRAERERQVAAAVRQEVLNAAS